MCESSPKRLIQLSQIQGFAFAQLKEKNFFFILFQLGIFNAGLNAVFECFIKMLLHFNHTKGASIETVYWEND